MTIPQFKKIFALYAKSMLDKWFDTKSFADTVCRSLGYAAITANIDKYDGYLNMVSDSNGQLMIDEFLDNMMNCYLPYQIDLTKYNMPFLPNKILLIGKQDIQALKNMCVEFVKKQEEHADAFEEYMPC